MKKQPTKQLFDDVDKDVDDVLAGKKKPAPATTAPADEEPTYYRMEKLGTYDWRLYELKGGVETLVKKDIQEICWAMLKRSILAAAQSKR